jgi:hypothetical protein
MSQDKQKAKRINNLNRLLQLVSKEAMNRRQLKDAMFLAQQTIDDYLAELKIEKRIYIAFWSRTNGMPSPYYMEGNSFDAKKPRTMTRAELTKRHETKVKTSELIMQPYKFEFVEPKFKPRRDIAASWF